VFCDNGTWRDEYKNLTDVFNFLDQIRLRSSCIPVNTVYGEIVGFFVIPCSVIH
jgi:hypothetical protein